MMIRSRILYFVEINNNENEFELIFNEDYCIDYKWQEVMALYIENKMMTV